MKVARSRFPRFFLLVALSTLLGAVGASAQQSALLLINVTNPTRVTITATTGAALNSDSDKSFGAGVDLANFFRSDASGSALELVSTTLTTFRDGAPTYDSAAVDNLTNSAFVDLNLFRNGGFSSPQAFSSGQSAFVGSITLNLSSINASLLPLVGMVGNIYAGNNFSGTARPTSDPDVIVNQTLIGQYSVVPEAGSGTLGLVGAATLMASRWRRRSIV